MTDLREQLAALAHDQWAGWMQWLFQFGEQHADGSFTINADKVARWQRQMRTPYAALSETEQASDRIEADKVLEIIAAHTTTGAILNYVRPLTHCGDGTLVCLADGCENRVYGLKLYCPKHLLRIKRHGDPTITLKRGRKSKV